MVQNSPYSIYIYFQYLFLENIHSRQGAPAREREQIIVTIITRGGGVIVMVRYMAQRESKSIYILYYEHTRYLAH